MDKSMRSSNNLRLPIDPNVANKVLQTRVQSWDAFFLKYSMEKNDERKLNLDTSQPVIAERDSEMRNPLSSVQYWVNTGKPPCLSVVDVNYNSPEETSLSEEEISADHPAAISPFEHNSPHPPQPAIIPSEPTKPSSSIASSDSVNTRDYILSSNLAKKNMSLTFVENCKLPDNTANNNNNNNNIDEADVYVDVCGTEEFPRMTNHNDEEKTFDSQSTIILDNNKIKMDVTSSQASTLLRIPTASLKIEDVIPSLRQIPEIYECDVSSSKSTSEDLKNLFTSKSIVLSPIINKNTRRKLFTNSKSPVEFPEYKSPKISRKSSSLSNNAFLHPALDLSRSIKRKQGEQKSYYKKKLSAISKLNKTTPPEKLLPCSQEEFFSNLQMKRKLDYESCDDKSKSKKRKISSEKNQCKSIDSQLTNLSQSPKIKGCSVILKPLDPATVKSKIPTEAKIEKSRIFPVNGSRKSAQNGINSKNKNTRKSARISRQNPSNSRVRKTLSEQLDSDDSKKTKNENSATENNLEIDKKRFASIFSFDDEDEESDVTDIFCLNVNNAKSKVKEEKEIGNEKNGNTSGNSFFRQLDYYTNEEKGNRKSTLNTQFNSTRRYTRLHIVTSSSEDDSKQSENVRRQSARSRKSSKFSHFFASSEEDSEDEDIFVSSPKKDVSKEISPVKEDNSQETKKKIKSQRTEKEENSIQPNSDNKKSDNVGRELTENEKNSKLLHFFSSDDEDSEDDIFYLNPKKNHTFDKNTEIAEKSCHSDHDNEERENIFDSSAKKNPTLKKEEKKTKKQINSKQKKKEENSTQTNFISDKKPKTTITTNKRNLSKQQTNNKRTGKEEKSTQPNSDKKSDNVGRELTKNEKNSKFLHFFSSDDEDSEDDIFYLNPKKNHTFDKNTEIAEKSCHSDHDNEERENIFDSSAKKNPVLKKEEKKTKKQINSKQTKKEENSTQLNFISDKKPKTTMTTNKRNFSKQQTNNKRTGKEEKSTQPNSDKKSDNVGRELTKNEKNSKFLHFFSSDDEDSKDDIFYLNANKNRTKTGGKENGNISSNSKQNIERYSKKDEFTKTKIQESVNDTKPLVSDDEDMFQINRSKNSAKILEKNKDNKNISPDSRKKSAKKTKIEESANHSNHTNSSEDEDIFYLNPKRNRTRIVEDENKTKFSSNSKKEISKNAKKKNLKTET